MVAIACLKVERAMIEIKRGWDLVQRSKDAVEIVARLVCVQWDIGFSKNRVNALLNDLKTDAGISGLNGFANYGSGLRRLRIIKRFEMVNEDVCIDEIISAHSFHRA